LKGCLIAIEGIDGSGTTTQSKLLYQWLIEKGIPAIHTEEPQANRPIGKLIRELLSHKESTPEVDALLFAADRADHVARVIFPHISKGCVVVCDRYLESSVAYQTAQGLSLEWILEINKFALPADLVVILDLPVELALSRLTGRSLEKFENASFLEEVRHNYLRRAAERGYPVVDASKPIERVQAEIRQLVVERFPELFKPSRKP